MRNYGHTVFAISALFSAFAHVTALGQTAAGSENCGKGGCEVVMRECEGGWTHIGYVLRPTTSSYILKSA